MILIKIFFWQALKMGFESPTRAAKSVAEAEAKTESQIRYLAFP